MKRVCCFLTFLYVLYFSSALGTVFDNNIHDTLKIAITENVNFSNLQKCIINADPYVCDTMIDQYKISYIIRDNEEIVSGFCKTNSDKQDLKLYAGREVMLYIKPQNNEMSCLKIDRSIFIPYIPEDNIAYYKICSFSYERQDNEDEIIFTSNLCIPDTDKCYSFELHVIDGRDILIKEIVEE